MVSFFVAHSHVDDPAAQELISELRRVYKMHSFWSVADLSGGQNEQAESSRRISQSDAFVYLLSTESLADTDCRKHHRQAIEENKRLLPVVIRAETKVPRDLRHLHPVDMSAGLRDQVAMRELHAAMQNLIEGFQAQRLTPSQPAPPAATSSADPNRQHLSNEVIVGIVGIVVALLCGVLTLQPGALGHNLLCYIGFPLLDCPNEQLPIGTVPTITPGFVSSECLDPGIFAGSVLSNVQSFDIGSESYGIAVASIDGSDKLFRFDLSGVPPQLELASITEIPISEPLFSLDHVTISPDNSYVAFQAKESANMMNRNIYRLTLPEGASLFPMVIHRADDVEPTWRLHQGNLFVVFSSDRNGDYGLFQTSFNGIDTETLLDLPGSNEREPMVLLDSMGLVLTSDRDGSSLHRYRMSFDQSGNFEPFMDDPLCQNG